MNNYVNTHLHTELSNAFTTIDSITKYTHYIKKAKKLGMTAIAFTEHGNVLSWVNKKKECDKNGIKYIHASEVYVTESLDYKTRDNYHVCLYAKNWEGVKELNLLLSNANNKNDGHFYYAPRITYKELINTSDNIIISTACLGGILHKAREKQLQKDFLNFLSKNSKRCFLEIQHHNVEEQKKYNQELYKYAKEYGIRLIAGTDTHALNQTHVKGRNILQKAKNIYFDNEEGWDLTFKTYDELVECYKQQNSLPIAVVLDAIQNTNVLADMIEPFTLNTSHKYPKMHDNSEVVFMNKIKKGIVKRRLNKLPNYKTEYVPRIKYEIEVFKHNDVIDYMLLEEKIKSNARKNGIYCGYGRGSVSGSVVAYILGITDMDAVKHNLNFERFMHKERVSLADIDSDWYADDREKIKDYVFNLEGVFCAEIVTFNTIALKGAIRDVGRALGMPLPVVDKISKSVDTEEEQLRKQYPELFEYVDIIQGTVVSIGSHPAGVVVSPIDLAENVGLMTSNKTGLPVTQLNMKELDYLNFVKLDILGLDNVGIINKTCKLAGIDRLTPDNIPDDEKVWQSMTESTLAVFQWESDIAYSILKSLFSEQTINRIKQNNPNFKYIDLFSVGNASIRPSGASYRNQLAQGLFHDNGHEALNKFLSSTLGYCIEENQKVATTNGLKKIKDITDKDFVYTENGVNKVFNKVYMGKKDTFKITTENTEIITTKDHKILTAQGWKEAKDINVGDVVAYRVGNENKESQNKNLNKIIGYLLGDGMLTSRNNVGFINRDIDVITEFKRCVEDEFVELTCNINNRKSRVNNLDLYVSNVKYKKHSKATLPITVWLRKIGLKNVEGGGLGAREKFIPKHIFRGNKSSMLSLLGAYTDTDSCLKDGNKIILTYKTASKQLSDDLVELGRLLGYKFKVCYDKKADAYEVYVCNSKSLLRELYDFSIKIRKTFNLEELQPTIAVVDSRLPRNMIKAILKYNEISTKKVCNQTGVNLSSKSKYISIQNVKKISKSFPDVIPTYLLNDNVKWVVVEKIEGNGIQRVYDLEIDNEHNFTCQGVIVHNCIYQEQIMDFLHLFCKFTKGEADMVRRGLAKKVGTEQYLPKIEKGFIEVMQEKYNVAESESKEIIKSFMKVIEDASDYAFSLNHSQSYSYIGYACAYLRYYYPLEFLTVLSEVNKDNIEKTTEILDYAKTKNIKIEPIKFAKSKGEYFCDKNTNSIYRGVGSIKGLNVNIGNELYKIASYKRKSFSEVLEDIKNECKINSKQLNILIELDFFRQYGKIGKLLKVVEEYNTYSSRKTFAKDKFTNHDLLREYSKSETDKMFKELDYINLCIRLETTIKDEDIPLSQKIKNMIDYAGGVDVVYPDRQKNEFVVLSVNTKYTPTIELQRLCDGKITTVKVEKKFYFENQIDTGDIISLVAVNKKPKWTKKDGEWCKVEGEYNINITYTIM